MKTIFQRLLSIAAISLSIGTFSPSANAGGIEGALNGMFVNVTAPDVVSNQLSGGISGGGVYVRTPVSAIQLFTVDPPRFSIGCGGIDAYLGSFSFITADRLIQFMRNVAQNAAPLAFQMALESVNPQLSGMLKKFQSMAQQMNDQNRNSCQLAHGLIDASKSPKETYERLNATISDTWASTKKILFDDFNASADNTALSPSDTQKKAESSIEPDGKKSVQDLGNVTWNALKNREIDGFSFLGISDDSQSAKEIIMSLVGTVVRKADSNKDNAPQSPTYAFRLSLHQLVEPSQNPDGSKGIPIWKCMDAECKSLSPGMFATSGLKGYVNKMMMGSEDPASPALAGSIVWSMMNCNTSNCGLTAQQAKFLNAIGSVPAVGLFRRAQRVPNLISQVAPDLIESMTNEIALQYAETVLDLAITTYSGTQTPKPDGFDGAIMSMRKDIGEIRRLHKELTGRMNLTVAQIDNAIRAASKPFVKTWR